MKKLIYIALIIALVPLVEAEVSLIVDQAEYYFNIGTEAVIELNFSNTGNPVDSILTHSVSQSIQQGGFSYISSNSNSRDFYVDGGESSIQIGFGTSEQPTKLSVKLDLTYVTDVKKKSELEFNVYFVEEDSQQQNAKKETKSETAKDPPPKSREQQLKEQLQNNQIPQDTSALKSELEKDTQQKKELQDEFQKSVNENRELQEKHNELLGEGYKIEDQDINPISNNSGSFERTYIKNESIARLQGELENGELTKLDVEEQIKEDHFLKLLENDSKYIEFKQELESEGFNKTGVEINRIGNNTVLKVNYRNDKSASINAKFENKILTEVSLNKTIGLSKYWFLLLLVLIPFLLRKKKVANEIIKVSEFNYVTESVNLLKKSKTLFKMGQFKEAYGMAGQSIKLYISYKNGLKKELTNDKIINLLKDNDQPIEAIKECLDLCSIVEFAKYQANEKDFNKIVKLAEKIIKG